MYKIAHMSNIISITIFHNKATYTNIMELIFTDRYFRYSNLSCKIFSFYDLRITDKDITKRIISGL